MAAPPAPSFLRARVMIDSRAWLVLSLTAGALAVGPAGAVTNLGRGVWGVLRGA